MGFEDGPKNRKLCLLVFSTQGGGGTVQYGTIQPQISLFGARNSKTPIL